MTIKTFRGKLEDGGQDQIFLHGGATGDGFKLAKFEVIGPDGNTNIEAVLQIYLVKQAAASTTIDFTDTTLLAAAIYNDESAGGPSSTSATAQVVFDHTVFNQDIYITSKCHDNTGAMNYYIELEQVMMPKGEQAVVNFNAALIHGD